MGERLKKIIKSRKKWWLKLLKDKSKVLENKDCQEYLGKSNVKFNNSNKHEKTGQGRLCEKMKGGKRMIWKR